MLEGTTIREWRSSQGLSQEQLAELLGFKGASRGQSLGRIERGGATLTKSKERILRRLMARAAGGASSDGPGGGELPNPAAAGTDPDAAVGDPFAAVDDGAPFDSPPAGIEPGEPLGDEPRTRRLGEFESLEHELLRLMVGEQYQYEDFVNGRPVTKVGQIPGLTTVLDGLGWHGDATLVRQLAPQLAHGYVEWGRHNRRVLAILRMLTAGGAAKEALIPTAQLVFGLAMLHGLMPRPADLIAQMRQPAAEPQSEDYIP